MIDEAALAAAREMYARALTQTARRERAATEKNGAGGRRVMGQQAEAFPCRVLLTPAPPGEAGERETPAMQARIRLPIDADVTAGDLLVVDGARYAVLSTDAGRADALCRVALCRKRD